MARSVNKVILIGNLTRDPELRYTPQGHAVCSFGVATNREWKTDGESKESTEFHNIVSWNKLAELCSQLLSKGTKVYVEGRLQTRDWEDDKGTKKYRTEIIIEEMVVLSSRRDGPSGAVSTGNTGTVKEKENETSSNVSEEVPAEDIPF
ncbi:hypothetical protein A3H26_03995 [candidate division WWE3 bacterium RIFCSPLOWO2_12_FULL_36_10]|uniref:Single-stranded DNA-binding protein n=1 Tax=candidate division WWE3 bacterium RIFCSPLOWO2_12_FULL_36_10 TaxID=1802630 RepID=A0A1F4VLE4_UNCKA|nr:MAG: hypothetical protein A3H26_03995 [candidate division WWE3 bacterium RIFCSPLOWO2_12_FULL_36_10]